MAHKNEKEETEFKAVPESRTLCISCGVAGISAANICQVCFNATASSSTIKPRRSASIKSPEEIKSDQTPKNADEKGDAVVAVKKEVNRCSGCRKKVGLTGIRCRCGELFCSAHRYSDRHDCSYDYKAAGREAISRENPVVKAAKIARI